MNLRIYSFSDKSIAVIDAKIKGRNAKTAAGYFFRFFGAQSAKKLDKICFYCENKRQKK